MCFFRLPLVTNDIPLLWQCVAQASATCLFFGGMDMPFPAVGDEKSLRLVSCLCVQPNTQQALTKLAVGQCHTIQLYMKCKRGTIWQIVKCFLLSVEALYGRRLHARCKVWNTGNGYLECHRHSFLTNQIHLLIIIQYAHKNMLNIESIYTDIQCTTVHNSCNWNINKGKCIGHNREESLVTTSGSCQL